MALTEQELDEMEQQLKAAFKQAVKDVANWNGFYAAEGTVARETSITAMATTAQALLTLDDKQQALKESKTFPLEGKK
jgi:hypothetical protein